MRVYAPSGLFLISAFLASPVFGQEQCLKSGDGPYALEGQLTAGRFRDAANRPESALILILPKSVCMTGDGEEDKVKGTNRVHVFASDEALHKRLQALTGKRITVSGEPFGAHTSHHHAPIVLNVSKLGGQ